MKYLVKTTYTAKATHPHEKEGTKQIWYTGKSGTVHRNIEPFLHGWGCEGWSRKHFAEKEIKDQLAFHYMSAQHEAWDIDLEIVDI